MNSREKLRVFGFSHECFMVDTQIIYPCVFLPEAIERELSPNSRAFKRCFETLQSRFNLIIMRGNDDEFFHLIFTKLRKFLDEIKIITRKTRRTKGNVESFERKVSSLLRSVDFGDLGLYWKIHKQDFCEWLKFDETTIRNRENRLIAQTLQKYNELTFNFKAPWDEDDELMCLGFYNSLKEERKLGNLPKDVDDQDLKILACCIVYVFRYLPHGILYLITHDKALFESANKVKGTKIPIDGKKIRWAGFDAIKPQDFLNQMEKHLKGTKLI